MTFFSHTKPRVIEWSMQLSTISASSGNETQNNYTSWPYWAQIWQNILKLYKCTAFTESPPPDKPPLAVAKLNCFVLILWVHFTFPWRNIQRNTNEATSTHPGLPPNPYLLLMLQKRGVMHQKLQITPRSATKWLRTASSCLVYTYNGKATLFIATLELPLLRVEGG